MDEWGDNDDYELAILREFGYDDAIVEAVELDEAYDA